MEISGINRTMNAAEKGRQKPPAPDSTSRALTVLENYSAGGSGRPMHGAGPHRRSSAFLAHLALQYDDVVSRRRLRAERLEAAIANYDVEARQRNAARSRPTHDLKI